MKLTLGKLRYFWSQADSLLKREESKHILDRAREIIAASEQLTAGQATPAPTNLVPFAPADQGVAANNRWDSFNNMRAKFPEAEQSFSLLYAHPEQEEPSFWVFSTARAGKAGESQSVGDRVKRPHRRFASNNYPFVIGSFLQRARGVGTIEDILSGGFASAMVSDYPDEDEQREPAHQLAVLRHKFVTKYLWMLANRESVVHIVSFESFREIMQSGLYTEVTGRELDPNDLRAGADFNRFTGAWQAFTEALLEKLKVGRDQLGRLSQLLALISLRTQDIRNIRDLLQTGNKAVVLWGPPGTGKTYEARQVIAAMLDLPDTGELEKHRFSEAIENGAPPAGFGGCYEIIQFHPGYSYEDLIGGIRPKIVGTGGIGYELRSGVFKRFCETAARYADAHLSAGATPSDAEARRGLPPFLFIIDEINRAELSAVFGELLYALEYRGERLTLPNFAEPFQIPDNVYLIGTMNNVDKSLVSFDLALRRRFSFFKLPPRLEVIEDVLGDTLTPENLSDYVARCRVLNRAIEKKLRLTPDHLIGQAYFLKIRDFLEPAAGERTAVTAYELEKLWVYHLQPLLEEYLGARSEGDDDARNLKQLREAFVEGAAEPAG